MKLLPGDSGRCRLVWKIQPSTGTPSRKKPSSAAMYGAAKKSAISPVTSRATSPAFVVGTASRLPRALAQTVSPNAIATPRTAGRFDHFASRSFGFSTPGIATVAQSTSASTPSSAARPARQTGARDLPELARREAPVRLKHGNREEADQQPDDVHLAQTRVLP